LTGDVTKIAAIANARGEFGPSDGVTKFDDEVTIEQRGGLRLRPGVSAQEVIAVDHPPAVADVPLQRVVGENGTHSCFVAAAAGSAVGRAVEVGASNDHYVQITSGLEPGEKVLLYNASLGRRQSEGPATTPPSGDGAGGADAAATTAAAAVGAGK